MLLASNLNPLEAERAQMWELFGLLMELDHPFTAKQLAKDLEYSKSELNKLLFRLYLQKALLITAKTTNGASVYSLNTDFLTGDLQQA